MLEMFEDKAVKHQKEIRAFVRPIVETGVKRKREAQMEPGGGAKRGDLKEKGELQEGMTFLDYLMLETDGEHSCSFQLPLAPNHCMFFTPRC